MLPQRAPLLRARGRESQHCRELHHRSTSSIAAKGRTSEGHAAALRAAPLCQGPHRQGPHRQGPHCRGTHRRGTHRRGTHRRGSHHHAKSHTTTTGVTSPRGQRWACTTGASLSTAEVELRPSPRRRRSPPIWHSNPYPRHHGRCQ